MNRTLKVLGLGLFAAIAMSAFAVVGASGNINAHTGGHFVADPGAIAPIKVHGHSNTTNHRVHLHAFGSSVTCTEAYHGTLNSTTVTSVTVTPTYGPCDGGRIVRMNGCTYTFTIRDTNASTLHNAVHLVCPAGKKAEVEAPGECVITFGPQTITNGVTYTTDITAAGKHAITADITATNIVYEKHGFCEFLAPFGTGPHTGATMTGAATLTGIDATGAQVGITATGSNGH